jgi:hypothetical protein
MRKEIMEKPVSTPMEELQAVLGRYDHQFDEPDTISFIAKLRQKGIIKDTEWEQMLKWLDEAMRSLKKKMPEDENRNILIITGIRNADWIRIVHAQRLAGYCMPSWASLWLWWIGNDREGGKWWKKVGAVAKTMKFRPFE